LAFTKRLFNPTGGLFTGEEGLPYGTVFELQFSHETDDEPFFDLGFSSIRPSIVGGL
jgi:hypothetical protein